MVRIMVEECGPHLTSMETALSDHSDRLTSLEGQMKQLQTENGQLKQKTEDLENRSRHNNIRVVGLPEGSEGRSTTEFMSKFLVDILKYDTFTTPPELDRAHRTLRPKPAEGEQPRPMIIRFLCYKQREQMIALARKK